MPWRVNILKGQLFVHTKVKTLYPPALGSLGGHNNSRVWSTVDRVNVKHETLQCHHLPCYGVIDVDWQNTDATSRTWRYACTPCYSHMHTVFTQLKTFRQVKPGIGKVRPTGQIQPASYIDPAHGSSLVLTLNPARDLPQNASKDEGLSSCWQW